MSTKSYLVQYLHRYAFRPVVTTWTKAIYAGYFSTWPGLTSEIVCKHLPKSMATSKGHLRQICQNVCSTKPLTALTNTPDATCICTHEVFDQTIKFKGKITTNQTGRFPLTSSSGSKYIMVLYDHDNNAIIPTLQSLDNKCPEALKSFMHKEGVNFQLIPHHLQHINATYASSRPLKIIFFQPLAAVTHTFPYIFVIVSCHKLFLHFF